MTPERSEAAQVGGDSSLRTSRSDSSGYIQYLTPEALFHAHNLRLLRVLTLVSGDRSLAEEALQEAFAEACLRWERIKRYEEPAAWVCRVALNRLKNADRSLMRRARALARLGAQQQRAEVDVASFSDPELVRALQGLPERQRTAIVLHYVGDLAVADVARSMGISAGAVNRHLHRARQALRIALEVER